MMNFFRRMDVVTAITLAFLLIASMFVKNFWCRYLCPYGALMGLIGAMSPVRIRRDTGLCIDCAKCAKACPSMLPVDRLIQIRSPECIGCYECIAECPAAGALEMAAPGKRRVPAWAAAAMLAVVLFGITGYARWSGHWHTDVPSQRYFELVPAADEFGHP
jgi:polyferredoxin